VKSALASVGLFLALSGVSSAQEPKIEVFGGYSLEHISACGAPGDTFLTCSGFIETGNSNPANYNGWNVSATAFAFKFVGFSADFAGHYGTTLIGSVSPAPTSRYSFMFGPVAAFRGRTFSPFVHALFGGVFNKFGPFSVGEDVTNIPSYTEFAWSIGGGLDRNLSRHWAFRAGQLDYESVRVPASYSSGYPAVRGFRFSTGLIFKP
jgi:hypothetical protein